MRLVCVLLLCFALLQLFANFVIFATFAFCYFCSFLNCCHFCHFCKSSSLNLKKGCPGAFICAWFVVFCFALYFCNFLLRLQLLACLPFATFATFAAFAIFADRHFQI